MHSISVDLTIKGNAHRQLRGATQLAILARCLNILGVDVRIENPPDAMVESTRWEHFAYMHEPFGGEPDAEIYSTRWRHKNAARVHVKTNGCINEDEAMVDRADLFVAAIFNPRITGHERLMSVPMGVGERVLGALFSAGMIGFYIAAEVDAIREAFKQEPSNNPIWIGRSTRERAEILRTIKRKTPGAVIQTQSVDAAEYLRALCNAGAGIDLPGDAPKTYRFCELSMMGAAVIHTQPARHAQNTRLSDESNSVIVPHWGVPLSHTANVWDQVATEATRVYRESWSPLGQAREILDRLGYEYDDDSLSEVASEGDDMPDPFSGRRSVVSSDVRGSIGSEPDHGAR